MLAQKRVWVLWVGGWRGDERERKKKEREREDS